MNRVNEQNNRLVYHGKVVSVREVDLDFGNGQKATYELIGFNTATGVTALPLTPKGVMLIKHYQAGIKKETFSLPSGGLNQGENPEERMQLELQEELGFRAGKLVLMNRSHPLPGYIESEAGYLYLASELIPSRLPGDEPFEIENIEISRTSALNWIKQGKITDARTILAILYWDKFYG